eukprot:m.50254 g.50254  ORF g.50254 m.50254 type:complete len:765 (-) comp7501_c1_seq2:320-2614(-)
MEIATISELDLKTHGATLLLTNRVGSKVSCIAFSEGGGLIASGSEDGKVRLWKKDEGRIVHILRGHSAPVWSIAFSKGGARIASGAWDMYICIWNVRKGELIQKLCGHTSSVWSVSFSMFGETELLVSGGVDERVIFWNADDATIVDELKDGVVHPIYCVAVNPGGSLLAEGSLDTTVRVWSIGEGSRVWGNIAIMKSKMEKQRKSAFKARSGQQALKRAKDSNRKRKFDWFGADPNESTMDDGSSSNVSINEDVTFIVLKHHTRAVVSVSFSTDGSKLVSASHDNQAVIWDPDFGSKLRVIDSASKSPIWCCVFSRDSSFLAFGTGAGMIEFWDPRPEGKLLLSFKAHDAYIGACAFSSDGLFLSTASDDGSLRIWQLLPVQELLELLLTHIRKKEHERHLREARKKEMDTLNESIRRQREKDDKIEEQAEVLIANASPHRPLSRSSSIPERTYPTSFDLLNDEGESNALSELNLARANAIAELVKLKKKRLKEEEAKLHILEVEERVALLAKQTETRRRLQQLAMEKQIAENGGVVPKHEAIPSPDVEYVDAIHKRLNKLYARVGHKPSGATWTVMKLRDLSPGDYDKYTLLNSVMLKTLDYSEYHPTVIFEDDEVDDSTDDDNETEEELKREDEDDGNDDEEEEDFQDDLGSDTTLDDDYLGASFTSSLGESSHANTFISDSYTGDEEEEEEEEQPRIYVDAWCNAASKDASKGLLRALEQMVLRVGKEISFEPACTVAKLFSKMRKAVKRERRRSSKNDN